MMTRLVGWLFFTGVALLCLLLVAPGFIDWNARKHTVTSRLEAHFQRQIDVAGNMSLRLLPQPALMLEKVTVANAAGGKAPALMTLDRLGLRIKLMPLLNGKVEVESLDLVAPVFNFETMPDGRGNWEGVIKPSQDSGMGVQLNSVTVTGGAMTYGDIAMTDINLSITAATLRGPYRIDGGLRWRREMVKLTAETSWAAAPAPLPLRVELMPTGNLPHVTFDGTLDMRDALMLKGDITLDNGVVGSLFAPSTVRGFEFLADRADVKAAITLSRGSLALTDINAKFAQGGTLQGDVTVAEKKGEGPIVVVKADIANLRIGQGGGSFYDAVPRGFAGMFDVKGRNVAWQGHRLTSLAVKADIKPREWRLDDVRLAMADGTQAAITGTVLPAMESGSYTVNVKTPHGGKLTELLQPADNSIFKLLSDSGVIGALAFSGRVEVSPARLSLFNIDATVGDKMAVSGVINIDRASTRPNVVAKLNLNGGDIAQFTPSARDAFLPRLRVADTDLELNVKNFGMGNGVALSSLIFYATTGIDGMEISRAEGNLSDKESISFAGKVDPAGDVDMAYKLKTTRLPTIASVLGIGLPPMVDSWRTVDIAGGIKGNMRRHGFSIDGTADAARVRLTGTGVEQGQNIYRQMDIQLTHKDALRGWAMLGLPIGGLFGGEGDFTFAGAFKGNSDIYTVDNIVAKTGTLSTTGTYGRKEGKMVGDMTASRLDLDLWLANDTKPRAAMAFTLAGDELIFQSETVVNPQFTLEADAATIKLDPFTGGLWNGRFDGMLAFTRRDKGIWASGIKGRLEGADIAPLLTRMGIDGVTVNGVDLDVNLISADNTPASLAGDVGYRFGSFVVTRFSFSRLLETLNSLTAVPNGFERMVMGLFQGNGATTFRGVRGQAVVADGKITGRDIALTSADGTVTLDADIDIKSQDYNFNGWLQLKDARGLAPVRVTRPSVKRDYTIDADPLRKYVIVRNPGPVPTAPDISPMPEPVPVGAVETSVP